MTWTTEYDGVTQTWEINQGYPIGTNAGIRIRRTEGQSINDQEANARLIAAAPDLLEAAQKVLADLDEKPDYYVPGYHDLKQAIAKATGEGA